MQTYRSHRSESDGLVLITDRGIQILVPASEIRNLIAALQRQLDAGQGQLNEDRRQHYPAPNIKLGSTTE